MTVEEVITVHLNELTEISETNFRVKHYAARTRARTEPILLKTRQGGELKLLICFNMNPSWTLAALLEVKK